MERKFGFRTGHTSREWQFLEPLKNDRISMFGTPHKPEVTSRDASREMPDELPEDAYL
jgi:hypothetical protein